MKCNFLFLFVPKSESKSVLWIYIYVWSNFIAKDRGFIAQYFQKEYFCDHFFQFRFITFLGFKYDFYGVYLFMITMLILRKLNYFWKGRSVEVLKFTCQSLIYSINADNILQIKKVAKIGKILSFIISNANLK